MKTLKGYFVVAFLLCCIAIDARSQHLHFHSSGFYATTTSFASIDNTLFAGTEGGGGVWLSSDNGRTWTINDSALPLQNVWGLGVKGDTLYTGRDRLYKTTDKGKSWSEVDTERLIVQFNSFATHGTTLFVGTNGLGIFRLEDSSLRFLPIDSGLADLHIQSLLISGNQLLAGTVDGAIYRSTNNGDRWIRVTSSLGTLEGRTLVAMGSTIFAGGQHGIFRSTDNGDSWEQCDSTPANTSVVALETDGVNLFCGTSSNFFGAAVRMSTNGGTTWTKVDTVFNANHYADFNGDPGGRHMAVFGSTLLLGTTTGIYYADLMELTGVTQMEKNAASPPVFTIFPIPSRSELRVEYSQPTHNTECSVFNLCGKLLFTSPLSETGVATFNMEEFPEGVYFVRVGEGTKTETRIATVVH